MNSKEALERAKELVQTLIASGDILAFGKRIISAKDFFALPLEKQIELKNSVPRLDVNHWRKGRPKP